MKLIIRNSIVLGMALAVMLCEGAEISDKPSHGRPYFMPESKRKEIRELVAREEWAAKAYEAGKKAAEGGDGWWAAFLFALDGDKKYVPAAGKSLLATSKSWIDSRGDELENKEYWEGGIPGSGGGLNDVFYHLPYEPYIMYDFVHDGLDATAREEIRKGLWTGAEFRKRAMTRWWQTPNLMFKPTSVVALAGLALQDKEMIEWGFHREGPHFPGVTPLGAHGGVFRVMDAMLSGGGPWQEAPIYAIAHSDLYCMTAIAFYRSLYDGKDWWSWKTPSGGSAKALMDYYLDSAYPPETGPDGTQSYRFATYGDGSGNQYWERNFLVGPSRNQGLFRELEWAYIASRGDPRYAPFLAKSTAYKPDLWCRPPLPANPVYPPAPSTIWEGLGVAMLRSDETPGYWQNTNAIAVFQILTKSFSHDDLDKFSITLHGAGHLLYPDYCALQYEHPAIGWSGGTPGHNTMMVDGQDTGSAEPHVRRDSAPEVKYLATSASGVFDGVNQTRALLLAPEYLLDAFHADSLTPRTYDYILHSFGQAEPVSPKGWKPGQAPGRFKVGLAEAQTAITGDAWTLDFAIRDTNAQFKAGSRVSMAADDTTIVYAGHWGGRIAELFLERSGGKREIDPLGMLVARRENRRATTFVVAHEPFRAGAAPRIRSIERIAENEHALVVCVKADGFTDYAAVSFAHTASQEGKPEHTLVGANGESFAFKDYGYLRVTPDGKAVARGGWTGFKVAAKAGELAVNGKAAKAGSDGGMLTFGKTQEMAPMAQARIEPPFAVSQPSEVIRIGRPGSRETKFVFKNNLKQEISGRLEFVLPDGVTAEPAQPAFGPVAPGAQAEVAVTFNATSNAAAGEQALPYRFAYTADGSEVTTLHIATRLAVGPSLTLEYEAADRPFYQVYAPLYLMKMDMWHGQPNSLADDTGTLRLNKAPLFNFDIGGEPMLFPGQAVGYTWPTKAPAGHCANATMKCRYYVNCGDDRFTVYMDRDWTPTGTADFTVPGTWISPGGKPEWARVVAVDDKGKQSDAKPGTPQKVAALELAFPKADWNLAFEFNPPQAVTFDGTGIKFSISNIAGDEWSCGFCPPGGLDEWRKKTQEEE